MPTSPYSTVYAFGDSLSDAGNTYLLSISEEASILGFSPAPVSPPYARINYSGLSANVFSNGPVWTQDLAQALGLAMPAPSGVGATADTLRSALTSLVGAIPASIMVAVLEAAAGVSGSNPYVPVVSGASGGTDYAISGAVTGFTTENADPTAGLYDLNAQLTTFHRDVPTPLANALATISIGGNDVFNLVGDANFPNLYGTGTTLANVGGTQAGMDIAQSVGIEASFLASLVGLGVDNIVVMNVPDVGTTPEVTARGAAIAADATVLSKYYDNLLAIDVGALNSGTVHITIVDAFGLIDNAVANPAAYGLQNVTAPVYSGSFSSFTPADLVSSDPATQNTYLFFDKEHPTETGEDALAATAIGVPDFDASYYLSHNPDVAQAGVDPLANYLTTGWKEGRDPDAFFSTRYYEDQNPDVAAAGINPLVHYEQYGWHEGRDPSLAFSTDKYLQAYTDVAAAGVEPLSHYLHYGQAEGRMTFISTTHGTGQQNPLVDNAYYFAQYQDVAAAGVNPFTHYDTFGWHEGRNPDALFNTAYYLQQNPDVRAAGIDPMIHYELYGWKEGRSPSPQFSTTKYLAANPDVAAAGMDPLVHYEEYGLHEGRAIFSV